MLRRCSAASILLALVLLFGVVGSPARAGQPEPALTQETVYALAWDGNLYRITDLATGAATLIADTGVPGTSAFEVDAIAETGWVVDYDGSGAACHLWQINMATGTSVDRGALSGLTYCLSLDLNIEGALRVGYMKQGVPHLALVDRFGAEVLADVALDIGQRIIALATDPVSGALYGYFDTAGLGAIDPVSGDVTIVDADFPFGYSLDFSCSGDTLYWANQSYYQYGPTSPTVAPGAEHAVQGITDLTEAVSVACPTDLPTSGADPAGPTLLALALLLVGGCLLSQRSRNRPGTVRK